MKSDCNKMEYCLKLEYKWNTCIYERVAIFFIKLEYKRSVKKVRKKI